MNKYSTTLGYHIFTYGCQMNVRDSEIIAGLLTGLGGTEEPQAENAPQLWLQFCPPTRYWRAKQSVRSPSTYRREMLAEANVLRTGTSISSPIFTGAPGGNSTKAICMKTLPRMG